MSGGIQSKSQGTMNNLSKELDGYVKKAAKVIYHKLADLGYEWWEKRVWKGNVPEQRISLFKERYGIEDAFNPDTGIFLKDGKIVCFGDALVQGPIGNAYQRMCLLFGIRSGHQIRCLFERS